MNKERRAASDAVLPCDCRASSQGARHLHDDCHLQHGYYIVRRCVGHRFVFRCLEYAEQGTQPVGEGDVGVSQHAPEATGCEDRTE